MTNLYIYHVLDENLIYKVFLMYTEAGMYVRLTDQIKRSCTDFFMKENRLYNTLKDYVDDVISFDNLGIGNFNGILKTYFVFCSIVLIVFVIHLIIDFILSRLENFEFIIYPNFQRFVNMKNRTVSCFKSTCIMIKNQLY